MRPERKLSTVLFAAALVALGVAGRSANATTIDFEGFPDSTILTTQYPGLTFSNTIILTSGISLNEFEFPPYSGVNVASDNNGPITIDFSTPITSFSGYFTYVEPLTLDGFDASDTQVASAASAFSSNDALFGDPGSSPNEFIDLSFAGGMSSVTITGDPLGGSFTIDDVNLTAAVPEPKYSFLVLSSILGLYTIRRKLFMTRKSVLIAIMLVALFSLGGVSLYAYQSYRTPVQQETIPGRTLSNTIVVITTATTSRQQLQTIVATVGGQLMGFALTRGPNSYWTIDVPEATSDRDIDQISTLLVSTSKIIKGAETSPLATFQ